MENIEDLVKLRNFVNSRDGILLEKYISDYITTLACSGIEANIIKGMCMLFNEIKNIPEKYECIKENNNE